MFLCELYTSSSLRPVLICEARKRRSGIRGLGAVAVFQQGPYCTLLFAFSESRRRQNRRWGERMRERWRETDSLKENICALCSRQCSPAYYKMCCFPSDRHGILTQSHIMSTCSDVHQIPLQSWNQFWISKNHSKGKFRHVHALAKKKGQKTSKVCFCFYSRTWQVQIQLSRDKLLSRVNSEQIHKSHVDSTL